MNNFLPWSPDFKPDTSVLAVTASRTLAEAYDPMIDKYRHDIQTVRAAATVLARGPYGNMRDIFNDIRGPLPAGEPARREEAEHAKQRQQSLNPPAMDLGPPLGAADTRTAALAPAERNPAADPMFARFREQLPASVSDDKVAHLVLQTKQQAGITEAKDIAAIQTRGDDVFVMGSTPGQRARLDLAEPPPPLAQTQAQMLAFEQQHTQQRTLDNPTHGRSV